MDPIRKTIAEIRQNPSRFRATNGYGRLLDLLEEGCAPDALKQELRARAESASDLLWTIVQLDNVEPYVSEASQYISSVDKATAAYAIEIVLRSSKDPVQLRIALESLRSCDVAVCEHAIRTLAAEGLKRASEVFAAAGWDWAVAITDELFENPLSLKVVGDLVADMGRDRQIVGLILATLAMEKGQVVADCLKHSTHAWIRDYGEWLTANP